MSIDWTKPIRFKNGERAELIETLKDGQSGNFGPEYRRIVRRLAQPTDTTADQMASIWWFRDDGKSSWGEEYDLENVP
jgi:hypothetical protein